MRGNIHTHIAMINIQWTFVGGWEFDVDVFFCGNLKQTFLIFAFLAISKVQNNGIAVPDEYIFHRVIVPADQLFR